MTREEDLLCALLRRSLWAGGEAVAEYSPEEWEAAGRLAERAGVSGLVYESLGPLPVPEAVRDRLQKAAFETAVRYYQMAGFTVRTVALLQEKRIPVAVLKGVGLGGLYPKEEARKLSDLDLYVTEPARFDEACRLLEERGYIRLARQIDEQHHVEYSCPMPELKRSFLLELHRTVTIGFGRPEVDAGLERLFAPPLPLEEAQALGGPVPVLDLRRNALSLLLHMAGHFFSSGFSIRNLCDWAVFLHRYGHELSRTSFFQDVQDLGLSGFSHAVTGCAVRYLGLPESDFSLKMPSQEVMETLMRDMLEGGDLGTQDHSRVSSLVGAPKNARLDAYLRQLNEETERRYPKRKGWYPLYPFLWVGVLRRSFFGRHGSPWEIIKTYRQRSKLYRALKLFEKENET